MLTKVNVKMLILNDEQKVIRNTYSINEFVISRYHFRSSLLYKQFS